MPHFIDLSSRRRPALDDETWDIRISELQRQILCEALSYMSHCDKSNTAKALEARDMLNILLDKPEAPLRRPGINSLVL